VKEPKKKPPPMVVVTAKVTAEQKAKFRQLGGKRFREWIDRARVEK
jgi:hypothetical protein